MSQQNNAAGDDGTKGAQLNSKQKAFVLAYTRPDIGFNATRAYAEAYGTDLNVKYHNAGASGHKLLKKAEIQNAIRREIERRASDHDELVRTVLTEWMKMATVDITEFINMAGPLIMPKQIEDMPPQLTGMIKSIKATQSGVELTLHDKAKALDSLARALGMFVDKTQEVGGDYESIIEKIAKERENNT